MNSPLVWLALALIGSGVGWFLWHKYHAWLIAKTAAAAAAAVKPVPVDPAPKK